MGSRVGSFFKAISRMGWGGWVALGGMAVGFLAVLVFTPPWLGFPLALFLVLLFWFQMFKGMTDDEQLKSIGVEAEAKILSFQENGASLQVGGSLPKAGIAFELEVHPKKLPAYTTTTDAFVSVFEMQTLQNRGTINVKYDPANPKKVTLLLS